MKRVTLRTVAKQAGVSYQTVSNVINNLELVRPETRLRVQQVIQEMGYVPSYAAKALRQARSMTVAAVFHHMTETEVRDPYRTLVQAALAHAARQHHHSLLTYHVSESKADMEDLMQHFAEGRLDGAVVVGLELPEEHQRQLQQAGQTFVTFDHFVAGQQGIAVTAQYREGIHQVLQHLVSRGRSRIAFVSGVPVSNPRGEERLEGYLEGMQQLGLTTEQGHLQDGSWNFEGGLQAFERLWSLEHRPDAIVAANDRMAAGLLSAALRAGVRVPAELAITGVDDFEFAQYLFPTLTTVHVPYQEMAHHAISLLLPGTHPRQTHRFPVTLQVRESS